MATRRIRIDDSQFEAIGKALADSSRVKMLKKIGQSAEAPTCTCIRESLDLAPATISHHLKELENAGLLQVERHGKFSRLSLRRDVLKAYLDRLASI
jgi:ArsR family transcriptional regulator